MRNILKTGTLEALAALNHELDILAQEKLNVQAGHISWDSLERHIEDVERYIAGYFQVHFNEQENQYCLVPIVR